MVPLVRPSPPRRRSSSQRVLYTAPSFFKFLASATQNSMTELALPRSWTCRPLDKISKITFCSLLSTPVRLRSRPNTMTLAYADSRCPFDSESTYQQRDIRRPGASRIRQLTDRPIVDTNRGFPCIPTIVDVHKRERQDPCFRTESIQRCVSATTHP